MLITVEDLRRWLARLDTFYDGGRRRIDLKRYDMFPGRPGYTGIRRVIAMADGATASIQYSATHYCRGADDAPESLEMWCCPHHPILDAHGDGMSPYAFVPVQVVVDYINAHGGLHALELAQ